MRYPAPAASVSRPVSPGRSVAPPMQCPAPAASASRPVSRAASLALARRTVIAVSAFRRSARIRRYRSLAPLLAAGKPRPQVRLAPPPRPQRRPALRPLPWLEPLLMAPARLPDQPTPRRRAMPKARPKPTPTTVRKFALNTGPSFVFARDGPPLLSPGFRAQLPGKPTATRTRSASSAPSGTRSRYRATARNI